MRTSIFGILVVSTLAVVGCTHSNEMKHEHKHMGDMMSTTQPMSMKDDCTHCAGNQVASAAGVCPVCGMKMK